MWARRPQVVIFGTGYPIPDGTCVRDYVNVLDLAEAHILSLRALDRGSCRYNLGNGAGYSVREVIDADREVTGLEIPVREGPRRTGDPPVLVASSRKMWPGLPPCKTLSGHEFFAGLGRFFVDSPAGETSYIHRMQPAPRGLAGGRKLAETMEERKCRCSTRLVWPTSSQPH